jgi:hypothetical protein
MKITNFSSSTLNGKDIPTGTVFKGQMSGHSPSI